MSIQHCPKPAGHTYTRVCNSLLDDARLSSKTVGLLVRLLRHKATWQVNLQAYARRYKEGESALRSAIAEAVTYGYAEKQPWRDPRTGRLKGSTYVIYECPEDRHTEMAKTAISVCDREAENPSLGESEPREIAGHSNDLKDLSNDGKREKDGDFSFSPAEEAHTPPFNNRPTEEKPETAPEHFSSAPARADPGPLVYHGVALDADPKLAALTAAMRERPATEDELAQLDSLPPQTYAQLEHAAWELCQEAGFKPTFVAPPMLRDLMLQLWLSQQGGLP
jgi:hypothetical protein